MALPKRRSKAWRQCRAIEAANDELSTKHAKRESVRFCHHAALLPDRSAGRYHARQSRGYPRPEARVNNNQDESFRRACHLLVLPFFLALGCGPQELEPALGSAATNAPQTAEPTLTRVQAEQYMLSRINHDRTALGLPPLVWDETAAKAARRHAEDMATHGFTSHWGSDGSVPEQRYTEAGGEDVVFENVGCFVDGVAQPLAPNALYAMEGLDSFERAFMDEVPPHDGHRRNILSRAHTAVGVGVAQVEGSRIPCVAQEFVDDHGDYASLPRRARVGDFIEIRGELHPHVELVLVGIARLDSPTPRTARELNETRDYLVPEPYEAYFPRRFTPPYPPSPLVLSLVERKLTLGVTLDEDDKPGVYEVSIWANLPGLSEERLISLRTIHVSPANAR